MKDDTISRAAALNALGERPEVWTSDDDYALGARNQYDMDRLAIETVPPAQPECEDAVSRFKVLRLIDYSSHDLNDSVDNRYMQNEIKQLPSVTPKQPGWIPCSERLPEDEEEVIVSIHDDSGDYACDYTSFGWYAAAGEFWVVDNEANMRVTAWMPLPEAWKGERYE